MGLGGYDLGQDLEWDEAVITLNQTSDRQTDIRHQISEFFVLHCYRGLPSNGLITQSSIIVMFLIYALLWIFWACLFQVFLVFLLADALSGVSCFTW